MVDEVVAEKVKGEMAQDLVKRILLVPVDATKEEVAGEIDKLLGDDKIKAALSKLYTDQPVPVGGGRIPAAHEPPHQAAGHIGIWR